MTNKRMTVTTNNNEMIGGTAYEVVRQLREDAWFAEDTKEDYMFEVSRRARMYNGTRVRFDTPENFLNDLADGGLLKIGEAQ